ncbi:MAG: IPT/TIG domain-containing protein, partial [Tepidiformaceae bacterium]
NFISNSKVQWNGVDRTTSYVDPTHLTADILQSDLVNAGTGALRVVNPSPGGGTSSASNFTITAAPNPVPSVSDVTPDTSIALGAQFTLTVDGSNFVAGSVVKWDGTSLVTHYVSDSQLTATVPAANILVPKTVNITVFNPTPAGGTSVEATPFTVNTAAAKLTFTKQPGNGVSGALLSSQPTVAIQTVGGVTVTSDSATSVTLALIGTGTLTCTGGLSKTAVSGVATFVGCSVTGAATTGLTIIATADSLTPTTSTAFNITAAPAVSSTQLVVVAPAAGVFVPRSRLAFTAIVGTISPAPTALTFVLKRKSDNKYWNDETGAWQADSFENPAVAGDSDGTWIYEVTGDNRRQFVGTTVIVTAHASTDSALYESNVKPEIAIR